MRVVIRELTSLLRPRSLSLNRKCSRQHYREFSGYLAGSGAAGLLRGFARDVPGAAGLPDNLTRCLVSARLYAAPQEGIEFRGTKTVKEMLEGVPTAGDIDGKKSNNGCTFWRRGYKFHLDFADGQISISALLTAASVHDSQVAIPLMEMSSKRVTYLYEIMDSAYDASAIYQASADRNHQPIINPHTRPKSETQLPLLVKLQPQLGPAKAERYKIRTMVERVFGRLKDEFGANRIRVRGAEKVMAHLMFSVLALTVDQLLRLHP